MGQEANRVHTGEEAVVPGALLRAPALILPHGQQGASIIFCEGLSHIGAPAAASRPRGVTALLCLPSQASGPVLPRTSLTSHSLVGGGPETAPSTLVTPDRQQRGNQRPEE